MKLDETLARLIEGAWAEHSLVASSPYAVAESVPILWFGDMRAYLASPLKIVTAGLNPSVAEFPKDDPYRRFPSLAGKTGPNLSTEVLAQDLSEYFNIHPYMKWFNSLEYVLEGLRASFRTYRLSTSVALHTDLCSCAATDPTWRKLPGAFRRSLAERGRLLWMDLIRYLAPDVVITSVAKEHLGFIDPRNVDGWDLLFEVRRTRPYPVRMTRLLEWKQAPCWFGGGPQTLRSARSHT